MITQLADFTVIVDVLIGIPLGLIGQVVFQLA